MTKKMSLQITWMAFHLYHLESHRLSCQSTRWVSHCQGYGSADVSNRAGPFPCFTAALYIIKVLETELCWQFCWQFWGMMHGTEKNPFWAMSCWHQGNYVPARKRQFDLEGFCRVELDSWKEAWLTVLKTHCCHAELGSWASSVFSWRNLLNESESRYSS